MYLLLAGYQPLFLFHQAVHHTAFLRVLRLVAYSLSMGMRPRAPATVKY